MPVLALGEALCLLVVRRLWTGSWSLHDLLRRGQGREALTAPEKRLAEGADGALRRLRVSCLWRAIVVTEMLRRRGIGARIQISTRCSAPSDAHAVVRVGDVVLRDEDLTGFAVFR